MTSDILKSNDEEEGLQVLLEAGASFEGELRFKGTARLSGKFKGTIFGEGTLIIDSQFQIEADIHVNRFILLGNLKGCVTAKKQVVMEPPARFQGEVIAPSLSVKEGVSFEGSSRKPKLKE